MMRLSNLELEVLDALGITFKNGYFHSDKTGNDFFCKSTTRGRVKEFGTNEMFIKYEYSGKDGTIVFLEKEDIWFSDHYPTFYLKLNGITLTVKRDPSKSISFDGQEGENEDIINDINRIYIDAAATGEEKCQASIILNPGDGRDSDYQLSSTAFMIGKLNVVDTIHGRINGLVHENGDGKTISELSLENYSDIFSEIVKRVYGKSPILVDYFLQLMPLFEKIFKATLYVPAINEQSIKAHIHNSIIRLECSATNERNNQTEIFALEQIEKKLDDIIEKYPVEKGAQK